MVFLGPRDRRRAQDSVVVVDEASTPCDAVAVDPQPVHGVPLQPTDIDGGVDAVEFLRRRLLLGGDGERRVVLRSMGIASLRVRD